MILSDKRYDMWREVSRLKTELDSGNMPTDVRVRKTRQKNELQAALLETEPRTYEVMVQTAKQYWKASQVEENPMTQAAMLMQCFENCANAGIRPLDFLQEEAKYLC